MTVIENNWKSNFYRNYSGFFNRIITADSYMAYRPYGKHIIKTFISADKNIKIMDLGCGIGGFIRVFQEEGYRNIEGVDISDEDVKIAHSFGIKSVKRMGLFESFKSLKQDWYDVVLLLDIIEHFKHEDILVILNESNRILKSGGAIIIHVPNAEGIFGSKIRYSDFTHEMAFTSKSLSQICAYSGFKSGECLEDKPIIHGLTSFIRRIIWEILTVPFRILHATETGTYKVNLSQNILFKAIKS